MTRPISFCFAATLAIVAAVADCTSSSPKDNAESRSKAAQTNAQLGMTYLHQGNLAAARDRIDKAIEQDPRTSETQMAAGFLYDRLGDDRKAQSHYDHAVRLADGNPEVLNNAAVFYCRKGDKKKGEKLVLEAAGNAMYRTPAATPLSSVTRKNPMSPVARTCVPPQSSRLKSGTETTRTRSPYFSPKSAIAPPAIASSVERTLVCTGVLR